jgi:hypothetical protein
MHRGIGVALVALAMSGCRKPAPSAAPADAGAAIGNLSAAEAAQVLARVGDHTITLGDYVAALEHMDSFDRVRYSAPARRRELLAEMIDVMLLADEARDKGYDKDPTTQQEEREILRDAFLEKARQSAPGPNDVPASEVQAYFEAHKAEFHDPERRRVSAVVLTSASSAASALDEALKASPPRWGEIVRTRSVDAQAKADVPPELAGDLGFVSPPGDPRGVNTRVPDAVRQAVFETGGAGEVLPRVVAADGKFYVVKLESKTAPQDRSLSDVERSIRVRLAQEKQRAAEETMVTDLRKQFPVQIDEAALSQVKVELPRADGGAP